jgi:uncharacterized protein
MRNKSRIFLLFGLVALIAVLGATCQPAISNHKGNTGQAEQKPQSPLPPPTGFVNDYSNVLDEATKHHLESTFTQLKERSAIEFAVVLVDTTEGQPINDYSMAVARGWGIGPEDTTRGGGLLLLVAVKDKQWRIEVSRGLEKDLSNDVVLHLGRLMNEPLRQQKYGEGVKKGVDAIITRLVQRRGFVMDEIRTETKCRP